jgi:xanthine dehydrogenase molybdopterin-binding subunit B
VAETDPKKPEYKLLGHNYALPDLVAKVTGRAKYAEDFRAEGMLFARLLLSPLPHARITRAAICALNAAIGDDYLRRTPATPSMIVASIDAEKRIDEGLVTHV